MATKTCSKCGEDRPLESFHKNKMGKLGRRSTCKVCCSDYQKEWFASLDEEGREKKKENGRRSRRNNLGADAEKSARRRLLIKEQTPDWNDALVMRMIYEDCPEKHQVDHIVPINGETVSGLHVHYNLQYLTDKQNQEKSNKWL